MPPSRRATTPHRERVKATQELFDANTAGQRERAARALALYDLCERCGWSRAAAGRVIKGGLSEARVSEIVQPMREKAEALRSPQVVRNPRWSGRTNPKKSGGW